MSYLCIIGQKAFIKEEVYDYDYSYATYLTANKFGWSTLND